MFGKSAMLAGHSIMCDMELCSETVKVTMPNYAKRSTRTK